MLLELLLTVADFVLEALYGWGLYSGSKNKQRAELESRVEFLERKLDRADEPIVKKDSTLK